MDSSELETVQGWCLRTDSEVQITYPKYVMGGLFACPHCGPIREKAPQLKHVVAPSEPLLERLRRTPPDTPPAGDARGELGARLIAWAADEENATWLDDDDDKPLVICTFCGATLGWIGEDHGGHADDCLHLAARQL